MLLIKGGRLIDPANRRDETAALLIEKGKIRDLLPGDGAPPGFDGKVIDA